MYNENIDKFGILKYLDKVVEDNNLPLTKEEIILGLLNGQKNYIRKVLGTKGLSGIDTVFWLPIELHGDIPSKSKYYYIPEEITGNFLLIYQINYIRINGIVDFTKSKISDLKKEDYYGLDTNDKKVRIH